MTNWAILSLRRGYKKNEIVSRILSSYPLPEREPRTRRRKKISPPSLISCHPASWHATKRGKKSADKALIFDFAPFSHTREKETFWQFYHIRRRRCRILISRAPVLPKTRCHFSVLEKCSKICALFLRDTNDDFYLICFSGLPDKNRALSRPRDRSCERFCGSVVCVFVCHGPQFVRAHVHNHNRTDRSNPAVVYYFA